jgi:glycosyltransferase involved in cell wall biosynthesis
LVRTAFVSTYPPRRCGIATFTYDLALGMGHREIVALHPPDQREPYPAEVHHRIRRDEFGEYIRAARTLTQCVDVVSIQHEYGIWGGIDGGNVLDFARALDVPAIATLHTVLRSPSPQQRVILSELVANTSAAVVMSQTAASLLVDAYGVDPRHVAVIPHGVPDLPMVDSSTIKPGLELDGRMVILSFGLLGPGKGYELMLDALPAIVKAHPSVCYAIVGATHPNLLLRDGEAYRRSLEERVAKLRLQKHVRFVDRFIGRVELTRWLEAADVFVTPYPNMDQIVSGTLAYAMGAGRAIVSTPYAYASELLADGRGVFVPPASPTALAAAVNELLADEKVRLEVGRRAYDHSRRMVWSSVAAEYRDLIGRVRSGAVPVPVGSNAHVESLHV